MASFPDPFSYFQPGYFGDKYPTVEGQVKLNTIPGQIRMPGEFPAYFGKGDEEKKRLTEDDLLGTYEVDRDSLRKDQDPDVMDEPQGAAMRKRIVPVTRGRGV